MKIFRNRTVIGVLCILLALVICFGVTPLFSRSASEKAEIVRVTADIKEGDEITAEMVQTVEVGAYMIVSVTPVCYTKKQSKQFVTTEMRGMLL